MKKNCAIHQAITENTENIFVKCTPHILIGESHDASISAISNSFHNICDPILEIFNVCTFFKFHFITFSLSTKTDEWTDQVTAFKVELLRRYSTG